MTELKCKCGMNNWKAFYDGKGATNDLDLVCIHCGEKWSAWVE